jgi:hypothetical protein
MTYAKSKHLKSNGGISMTNVVQTSPHRNVLVSVNFGRTPMWKGAIHNRVRYDMEKVTPFGLIRAEQFVPVAEIESKGIAVVDGEMFSKLSRALNDEEQARYLEAGATLTFGIDAA